MRRLLLYLLVLLPVSWNASAQTERTRLPAESTTVAAQMLNPANRILQIEWTLGPRVRRWCVPPGGWSMVGQTLVVTEVVPDLAALSGIKNTSCGNLTPVVFVRLEGEELRLSPAEREDAERHQRPFLVFQSGLHDWKIVFPPARPPNRSS